MLIYDLDIVFRLNHTKEFEDIPAKEIRAALQRRLDSLSDEEIHEAVGVVNVDESDNG